MFKVSGAKIQTPDGCLLAITVDTLISGVHFPVNTKPEDVGHKSLAVNLSDLAAMGALPKWFTLTLILPEENPEKIPEENAGWLVGFEKGLMALAEQHKVQLVSVDYHKGPLAITISAIGIVEEGRALLRSGAQHGDLVYVTGTLGDAGAALAHSLGKHDLEEHSFLLNRLNRPEPRIAAGRALLGTANSAIDISDGLVADLGHICEASGIGAVVYAGKLPLSNALYTVTGEGAIQFALASGDDYELCFTVPKDKQNQLERAFAELDLKCICIGEIVEGEGVKVFDKSGDEVVLEKGGYQHF